MKYSDLPSFVKSSTVFSSVDIEKLLVVDRLPEDAEVDALRDEPEIFDLLNAFIGDENSRALHLQLLAKKLLEANDVDKAWKVILI